MFQPVAAFSGFSVDSIERAKQFYVETLGLELADEKMGLELNLPSGGKVFVYEKGDHAPPTFTILNFVVEDIDQAVQALTAKGVQFEHYDNLPVPQDEQGILRGLAANQGPDIAWFTDPAGNILAVLQDS
jgi:catechol 2,3-dioxygenase-like lactoylglutathione lyase family enzyme